MNCARIACGRSLRDHHYRIWNEPSTNQPRLYCVSCGRKIIEYNKTQDVEHRLHYEILTYLGAKA